MKDNEELIKWNKQSEKDLGFTTAIKNLENFDNLMKAKYEN